MKFGIVFAAAAAGVALAASAQATTVLVTNVQLAGPGPYYTVDINGEDAYDAAILLTIHGNVFFANCDDIYHNIYLGQQATFNVSNFSSQTIATNFGGGTYDPAQIGSMSYLAAVGEGGYTAGSASNPNEQEDLAALQLASWIIANPTASFTNYDAGVYSQAQTDIADAAGQTAPRGSYIDQLSSGSGVQGQLIDPMGAAVPEPAAWTMMLVGFGAIGAATRSRRRPAAVAA